MKIPMIRLLDGSSGGGSVATYLKNGYTYIPGLPAFDSIMKQLSSVPVITAGLGPVVGLGSAKACCSHFSVVERQIGRLFAAGPPVVAYATFEEGITQEELGGVEVHCRNGTYDNVADSEEECFEQMKRFLSYMPPHAGQLPPVFECDDPITRRDEWLASAIPARRQRTYEIRPVIESVVDKGSFFEIGALWGRSVVTGLARIGGYSVGILSADCQDGTGGTLESLGCQKIRRFVDLCNVFHIPIVQLIDNPGFAVGTVAEKAATIRNGVSATAALYSSDIPMFMIILRRSFGVAAGALMACRDLQVRVAWPSGDWGSLPLEGGIEAAYKNELKEAGDKKDEVRQKLLAQFDQVRNPICTAAAFAVEEVCFSIYTFLKSKFLSDI